MLGVAASLATVDGDGGFTLFANNRLIREFYGAKPLGQGVKLNVESVKSLLDGERDPGELEAYVEQMVGNYRAVVESGGAISTETYVLLPDGHKRWSRNTLTPVYDESRQMRRILVTSIDVSELHASRTEIESSLKTLLSQVITICTGCDKIADNNEWLSMTDYIGRHSELKFTHGICDKCRAYYFGSST